MDLTHQMTEEDCLSFLTKGYVHGNITDLQSVDFNQYTFIDCNSVVDDGKPEIDKRLYTILDTTKEFLIQNYVSKLFTKFTFLEAYAWSGVDPGSAVWHNDLREGFNSNILVYLDDSLDKNKIEVRNDHEEFCIYPKKGDFVWINQNRKFQHKATHVQGDRRVFSFEFNIDSLWT
jgi:hypothetical protein